MKEILPLDAAITEIFPIFEDYLQPARFKIAYGGRGSAKTRTFITILTNNVRFHGWRVGAFREIMKTVKESSYQEFVDEIVRTDCEHEFKFANGNIIHRYSGGKIVFDGLFRNQQKIKGYAGYDCFWVEEAENVSEESWQHLIPTLRVSGSELWVSYNPLNILSPTHVLFVTERNKRFPDFKNGKRYCVCKKINYKDNPRFPQELRDDMELMKENDYDLYLHVYEGEPVGDSDLAVIAPKWIASCIDAHKKTIAGSDLYLPFTGGGWMAGFDVADEGKDKNAFVWRHGCIVMGIEEWKDEDPNTAARFVFNNSLNMGMDTVTFDDIGVGAGAKGAIREEAKRVRDKSLKTKIPQYRGFTANASPLNPESFYMPGKKNEDMFRDLKAQSWWLVRDRFKNTYDALLGKPFDPDKLISLDSTLPLVGKMAAELSQPRRDLMNGKVLVESKKDMRKRGVMSPNLADALIMAFAPESGFKLDKLI